MLPKNFLLAWIVVLAIWPTGAVGQSPDAKALKYHQVLLKRAEPGYLYDRFYNTWLDESTVDQLQKFLTSRVQQTSKTADRLLLAFFHVKQGNDVAAIEEFRKALASDPASAATWYHKATVEARTLDFDTAIEDLKKAGQQKPKEKLAVQIDKQLGKLLVRNQQIEAALKVWQDLLKAHPGDEELQEDLIELHIDEGLYPQAAKLSQALIEQTKDPYLAVTRRLRLGDIHHRGGDRSKSLAIYTSALEQVGYDTWLEREVLSQIEHIFRREDDLTGLKKQYTTLLEQHDKRIAIHRRHAHLLAELGEADNAMAAYQKILALTPGDRANREAFVSLLTKMDRHPQAVKELEAICAQHAEDFELRFWLANLRHRAGQTDQVVAEVNRYLELSDGSEYAYLRAARLLERLKQTDAARGIYEEMTKKHSESPAARQAYAVFLYSQDKKDEALEIWRGLAAGADLNQTLHVVRSLVSRHEYETAFELLSARQSEFDDQQLYFGQLVTTAVALDKFEEAIPWVLRRVELAESVTELETAIGQAAMVFDRSDKVEETAQKLAAQSPRSVLLTCLLAELWEQTGNSEQADAVLADAAEAGQLLAVSQQIRLFTGRREWQNAAEATRRILELPGGQKSLHVRRLVELYTRDYQFDEALKWIESWRQLSPGSTSPWLAEARLLRLQGKEDDAINVLRKASQRFDDDEDLRAKLATTYTELGKLGDAERIYWQIYEQSEDLSGKLQWVQQLARLSQQQGKTTQLVENFEARRSNNRRSIVPLLALAEIHRVADNYEGRRQALTAASKIKPDDLQLLLQIARIEESEGNWESALATLERAAPKDKTNRTRERIAGLHFQYGESDDGFAILQELIEGKQSDPRAIESFADAMCAMQEWERAADFLQQHVTQYPADYRLHYLLGVALEEADQNGAAIDVFLSLLKDQEELPAKSKKKQTANRSFSSYIDLLKQLSPPDAADWLQLMQAKYTVYSFRQRNAQAFTVSVSGAGRGSRSMINMPGRVEDLRTYALAHLVTLREMIDEDQVADLAVRMEGFGVHDAHELLQLGTDQNSFGASVTEILAEQPQHETALAVMVLSRMGRPQNDNADHCAQAFKVFHQSYPQLALMAATQAAAQDAEHLPLLKQSLQDARDIKQPSPMLIISLVMQIGGQPGRQQQANELDADHRKQLTELIIDWYPHMLQSPQYSTWAFTYVTFALRNSGEPSTYISFLEDEVARWNSGKRSGNTQQMAAMFGRSRNNTLLKPLEFPPRQLVDFPINVLSMLREADDSNPFSHMMRQQSKTAWEMSALKPLLKDVKDPILRVLFARQADDYDNGTDETGNQNQLIEQTLSEMLAEDAPRADAYLLAAAWATLQENTERAVELLEKVRYLPMKRDIRRRVDSAIVAMAIEASEEKKSTDKLKESGRNAALRLRRGKLDANGRGELIAAMGELGLKKEAEKLERVATARPSPSVSASPRVTYSNTKSQKDRITKLVEQGKREMAAKLLAKEVTGQMQQYTQNLNNYGWRRHQYRQIRKRVQSLGMEKEVLAVLDPGQSTNPGRLSNYASVCEIFGKADLARAQFEKLLERRSKDDNSRIRLIMLLIENDPGAAHEHLAQLADSSSQMMGQVLSGSLNDHEMSLANRVAIVRTGYHYLQILKDRKKAQLNWIASLVHTLGRQMHSQGGNPLPSLYAIKKSSRKVSANRTALQKEREELHSQICRAMLESPQTARAGFKYLLAAAEAKQAVATAEDDAKGDIKDSVGAEYLEFAANLLRGEATGKPHQFAGQNMHISYSSNQSEVRFRSPEEFLARQAWQADNWTQLDEILLPELEQAARKQPYQSLQRLIQLYRCEEGEFVGLAKSTIRKRTRSAYPGMPNNEAISAVVDAWADRKLTADIRPMVLEHLKKEASGQNHHQAPGYVFRYIEHLADSPHAVADVLEEVATLYLGPKEQREKFIKKNSQQNRTQWGAPSGRIYVFRQLMGQLIQREDLMFATLRHLNQYGTSIPVQNFEHYVRNALQKFKELNPEELLDTLAQSPWLGNLEDFQPMAFTGVLEVAPLQTLVAGIVRDKENRQPIEDLLSDRQSQSPTFGTGLLLAAIQQKDKPLRLLEYLGDRIDAIVNLPEDRQVALAALLKQLVASDAMKQDDSSEPVVAVKSWLEGNQGKHIRQQLVTLLATKRFEELGIEYYRVDDYLSKRIPKLIAADPQAARDVFLKICDLAEDARRRGQWNSSYGSGRTLRGQLLGNLFNRGGNRYQDIEVLGFLVDVLQSDQTAQIEIDHGVQNAIERCLSHNYDHLLKEIPKGETRKTQAIQQLIEELTESLGDRPTSLLIPGYERLLSRKFNDDDRAQIAEWFGKEQTDSTRVAFMQNWQTALALSLAKRVRAKQKKSQPESDTPPTRIEKADHHTHLESLLNSADLSLSWRMHLANTAYDGERDRLPVQTALACLQVYNEALSAKVPLPSSQQTRLIDLSIALAGEAESEDSINVWREKWEARFLRSAVRKRNNEDDLYSVNNTSTLCRALKLYLVEEDSERIEKFLRRYEQLLGSNRLALTLLIRSGKHELAARLFRARWAEMNVHSDDPSLGKFDQTVLDNLPSFLEQLQQDDEKYTAETLVSSLSDSKSIEEAIEDRDARLTRLTGRLDQIEYTNPTYRNRLLEIFCTSDKAAPLIADAISKHYETLDLLSAAGSNDQNRLHQMLHIVSQHCRNEFRVGNPKPFVETIDKFNRHWTDDSYQLGRALEPLIECALDSIEQDGSNWSVDQSAAVAESLRSILTGRDHFHLNYFRKYNTLILAVHARAGMIGQLRSWYKALSANQQNTIKRQHEGTKTLEVASQMFPNRNDENLESRAAMARDMVQGSIDMHWLSWDGDRPYRLPGNVGRTVFHHVVNYGLLSADEIPQIADRIVEGESPHFLLVSDLAGWLHDEGKHKAAVNLWRVAIEATSDEQHVKRAFARFYLAEALHKTGNSKSAREELASIEEKHIPNSRKKQYNKLKKLLSEDEIQAQDQPVEKAAKSSSAASSPN